MSSFIFNGYNSDDLGLMVTKPIVRPSWAAMYSELTASGGIDASPENIHKIFKALNGSGKLVISTAPDEYLDVILSPITPEPVALLAAEISISVTARPFAYAVTPAITDLTGAAKFSKISTRAASVAAIFSLILR